jgi:hypothetical protein
MVCFASKSPTVVKETTTQALRTSQHGLARLPAVALELSALEPHGVPQVVKL